MPSMTVTNLDPDAARAELRFCAGQLEHARKRLDGCTGAAIAATINAAAAGISEAEMSRLTGVTRMTIRRWLGKP
jgi:hypothetical protein